MAQDRDIMSFRARLRGRGYSEISISKAMSPNGQWMMDSFGQDLYSVRCIEPLLGRHVWMAISITQMRNWPGIPFFDCGFFSNIDQIEIDDCGILHDHDYLQMDDSGGVYV